jgi:hypothetical protein
MSKNSLVVGNGSLVVVILCVQFLAPCLIYDIDVWNIEGFGAIEFRSWEEERRCNYHYRDS